MPVGAVGRRRRGAIGADVKPGRSGAPERLVDLKLDLLLGEPQIMGVPRAQHRELAPFLGSLRPGPQRLGDDLKRAWGLGNIHIGKSAVGHWLCSSPIYLEIEYGAGAWGEQTTLSHTNMNPYHGL